MCWYLCVSIGPLYLVSDLKLYLDLVSQILIPPKGLLAKLKREADNPKEVMDQVISLNSLPVYTLNCLFSHVKCIFVYAPIR